MKFAKKGKNKTFKSSVPIQCGLGNVTKPIKTSSISLKCDFLPGDVTSLVFGRAPYHQLFGPMHVAGSKAITPSSQFSSYVWLLKNQNEKFRKLYALIEKL